MIRILRSHLVFVNGFSHILKLRGLKHRPMGSHALLHRVTCSPVILQPRICHPLCHSLQFHSQICLQRIATSVRFISSYCDSSWTARSPDLAAQRFCFYEFLKPKAYATRPPTTYSLRFFHLMCRPVSQRGPWKLSNSGPTVCQVS